MGAHTAANSIVRRARRCVTITLALAMMPCLSWAAGATGSSVQEPLSPYVRLLVELSLLSFLPLALIATTSFTRIVITLSFLRHALGMPETPPNAVLLTLAMFLTFFTMAPTLEHSYNDGLAPFVANKIGSADALERGLAPMRTFMSAHVRAEDLTAVGELAKVEIPDNQSVVPLRVLVPAFMLSELRAAFVAGFMIFLPFLLIDLIVAAILMSLGMMMVPPVSISLPLKVMLFVLIDGWSLLIRAIAGAYM
jgi:flagellar biosynthetic protein FliP